MSLAYDVTKGPIFKRLLAIAIPVLLTSISQMAYNLTDMFWIGQVDTIGLIEKEAIAGIGTAGYITWFAFGLILIGRIGTSVKVSHAVGEQDFSRVAKYATNGLFVLFSFGLIFGFGVLLLQHQIVGLFQIDNQNVIHHALEYLRIVGGLLVIQFTISGFSSINEGLGKTKVNFYVLIVGLVLNMILDPLFILEFQMGVSGAAIATIIAQSVTLIIFIVLYFVRRNHNFHFHLPSIQRKTIAELIRIGFPAGIQSMFFTSISIVLARMVFAYGESVLTAQRIGAQIEQFTWMIGGGFQTALTVFVGQNYGAKQFNRIKRGTAVLASVLLPYALVITALLFFFSRELVHIFVDDLEVIEYGSLYLRIISIAQLFMMLEGIGAGLFNGVGLTKIPSISGIIGNLMRIPLAFLLIEAFAYEGIWWALNISDIFKGLTLLIGAFVLFPRIERWYSIDQAKKQKRLLNLSN